jgi:serine O-acetyltransferase
MVGLIDDLWRDLDRQTRMGARPRDIALDPGAWTVVTYRIGRALRALPKALRFPLRALHKPVELALRALTGVKLPLEADIGGGLYLAHTGHIEVSPEARVGRDCNLSHGAVVGAAWIGDRVYVGPGARIGGNVRVGNDAALGANALVEADVPDQGLVGGPPSKVVSLHGGRTRVVAGRKRPPLLEMVRAFLRDLLPRPTQLFLRAG